MFRKGLVAVKDPQRALAYIFGRIRGMNYLHAHRNISKLSSFLDKPAETLTQYLHELERDRAFQKYTRSIDEIYFRGGVLDSVEIYLICRAIRPAVVIETGVASGMSSTFILQALDDNAKGKLISIDQPNYDEEWIEAKKMRTKDPAQSNLPPGCEAGWAIPEGLKERWRLVLGKTENMLVPTLSQEGKIDLVLLDDDHSYSHVAWECETVLPYMAEGGILVVDDVNWHSAFSDFVSRRKLSRTLEMQRAAAVRTGEREVGSITGVP